MTPRFRFTIFNTALYPGGVVVNEPVGWKQAQISLELDTKLDSLIEYFEGDFIWFGLARRVIKEIAVAQGLGARIGLTIEICENVLFELLFSGNIDISESEDITQQTEFYKIKAPIIRDDTWARFINRKATPVQIDGALDEEGNAADIITASVFNLPSQKLRKNYQANQNNWTTTLTQGWLLSDYLQLDLDTESLSEFDTKFHIQNCVINHSLPANLWTVEEGGSYNFDLSFEISNETFPLIGKMVMLLRINDTTIPFVNVNSAAVGGYQTTIYTLSTTRTLVKGDKIYIYGQFITSNPPAPFYTPGVIYLWGVNFSIYGPGHNPSTIDNPSFIHIVADTTTPDTTVEAFTIYDWFKSIINKVTGVSNVFKSDYLQACGGNYKLMQGINVRGFSLAERPVSANFEDSWAGLRAILPVYIGYTDDGKIEIEHISEAYDPVPAVYLVLNKMVQKYDKSVVLKSIVIGYGKTSAESDDGSDGVQTQHTYATKLQSTGVDVTLLSKWFGESRGIEQARRNRKELGKDFRLDEDIMIVATNYDDPSRPQLAENFTFVDRVENYASRYNLQITPGRNFIRWRPYYNGGVLLGGGVYKFNKGIGNCNMVSNLSDPYCEDGDLGDFAENQNIDITNNYLFLPDTYSGSCVMTFGIYKQIRTNRKKALGILTKEGNLPMFIKSLKWGILSGRAALDLRLANDTPL